MDADPAAVPATDDPDLWTDCEERAVVRLTLANSQVFTDHYTSCGTGAACSATPTRG